MPKTTSTPRARKPCDQRLPDGRHARLPQRWQHGRRCGRRRLRSASSGWVSATRTQPPSAAPKLSPGMTATPAAFQQAAGEVLARQAGGAHVDQGEHPRLGAVDAQARRRRPAAHAISAARRANRSAIPAATGEGCGDCQRGHVGDEGLVAEQHGFGQRQQARAELGRADAPAGAEAGRGMGFGDRRGDDHPVGQRRVGERRGEGHVRRSTRSS